jgi:hypothetical protein
MVDPLERLVEELMPQGLEVAPMGMHQARRRASSVDPSWVAVA